MDERLCEANRQPREAKITTMVTLIDTHSLEIAEMRLDIAGQAKHTIHLQTAISSLQKSVDTLVIAIDNLKYKPVKNYEKIGWIVITAIVMYVLGRMGIK